MVKLSVENTNLQSPIAAIRWCVDKQTLNKQLELKVGKPYILFVIAREDDDGKFNEIDKMVVPLGQTMEYIAFHSPGKHRIFGLLVCSNCKNEKEAKNDIIRAQEINSYYISLQGALKRHVEHNIGSIDNMGSIDVVVPDGYFAKEPPVWEKWWVNLWYESKPTNSCHFRKRRLLAYSIQPPVVFGYVLCRTLLSFVHILYLLSIGIRNIHYEAIFHPFIYDRWGAAPNKLSSVFFENSSGAERHPIYILSIPLLQLVILGLLELAKMFLNRLGSNMGSVLLWLLAINVLAIVITSVINMLGVLDKLFPVEFPTETGEQKAIRIKLELDKLCAEYQDLTCINAPLLPRVSSLPSKRRTVYLRFQEFKTKVCLPFAR